MIDNPAMQHDVIASSEQSTVVASYVSDEDGMTNYQSEAELEREFVALLESQAYERVIARSEADLVVNLRAQLDLLNDMTFSDEEWSRFFEEYLAAANLGITEKAVLIHEDYVQVMTRDDGTTKNVRLLDKTSIHNNRLQVLTQYAVDRGGAAGGRHANRYDVTILVNGLPLVHIELKRRGVDIREAFNQIDRYQRDSFWAGAGLFQYVQLFVISNGTRTKYYSNTTRLRHISQSLQGRRRSKQTSNSFEFTSWWADAANRQILDLRSFAKTFFARHTLLNILTRYCVLTADRTLLVMRPYQIVATERILQRIEVATNYGRLGTVGAGGYVWHTTGSGKTLTSFKTAQLASRASGVEKVLFVVDRKDLDYQTMREYDRFEPGAANSNTSTAVLKRQLEDPTATIIITTIQKLTSFIRGNRGHSVFDQHVVIIFDECHRSQFGDMHGDITRAFKRYHLFGFTGTPIFAANAGSGAAHLRTTEQAFGDRLHTYTIQDAIGDKNVLPFKIDYVSTVKVGTVIDKEVSAIDRERALMAPDRVREVVAYTLEHFAQKTKRSSPYTHSVVTNVAAVAGGRPGSVAADMDVQRRLGFNAIFAVSSIEAAKRYYNQFAIQQQRLVPDLRLKVGLIYSYAANPGIEDGFLDEEDFDPTSLAADSREFLEDAIQDYNDMFGTSYDTSADRFQNYYKDLSLRLKNRDLDLLIVVNMFLTGFDATTLNTLFVDKNLKSHGLLQAFSRTNRILNSVKVCGNVVAFRDLEQETNDAIALFGNKEARGIVLLKPYAHYYAAYAADVQKLVATFDPRVLITSESAQKEFIAIFGSVVRLENILSSFDEFATQELLTERQRQDYRSVYLDLYAEFRREAAPEKESILDDVVFEIELIKQVDINVDYILLLVAKYRDRRGNGDDVEIRAEITRALDASPSLRSKRDLVEAFVDDISPSSTVDEDWVAFISGRREAELTDLIEREHLDEEKTRRFMAAALRDGVVQAMGTEIAGILPPVSRFSPDGTRAETKARVIALLTDFVERFYGLGGAD